MYSALRQSSMVLFLRQLLRWEDCGVNDAGVGDAAERDASAEPEHGGRSG